MSTNAPARITREIEALAEMSVRELQQRWYEVWGEPCRAKHKEFLRKRIAWKIQANAYGGLSHRALERARELADETLLKIRGVDAPARPAAFKSARLLPGDGRLPMPGTTLTRIYEGKLICVIVRADGFEWEGKKFKSLSAVAKAITGAHWNGYLFFGLTKQKEAA